MGKRALALFILITSSLFTQAQMEVEMADALYENGKIYVVVLVICIVFVGLFSYLIWQDRKLRKLELELKDED